MAKELTVWQQALYSATMIGQVKMSRLYLRSLCADDAEMKQAEALAEELGIALY